MCVGADAYVYLYLCCSAVILSQEEKFGLNLKHTQTGMVGLSKYSVCVYVFVCVSTEELQHVLKYET